LPLCSVGQFSCRNSPKCIPTSWLCDGARDCPDGSDETHSNCHSHRSNTTCSGDQPECRHGGFQRCIPQNWLCDGHMYVTDAVAERVLMKDFYASCSAPIVPEYLPIVHSRAFPKYNTHEESLVVSAVELMPWFLERCVWCFERLHGCFGIEEAGTMHSV
ncbi:Low-density lipoprotein receptor domain class A, partial [Cooperia oncophora]